MGHCAAQGYLFKNDQDGVLDHWISNLMIPVPQMVRYSGNYVLSAIHVAYWHSGDLAGRLGYVR